MCNYGIRPRFKCHANPSVYQACVCVCGQVTPVKETSNINKVTWVTYVCAYVHV